MGGNDLTVGALILLFVFWRGLAALLLVLVAGLVWGWPGMVVAVLAVAAALAAQWWRYR